MPTPEAVRRLSAPIAPALSIIVDLDNEIAAVDGSAHRSVLILARRAERPIAELAVALPPGGLTSEQVGRAFADFDSTSAPASHRHEQTDAPLTLEISVVVTTCGDPERLEPCLLSILDSSGVTVDVIVVDNRPADSRTRELIDSRFATETRIRLVDEPRQGLSFARNAGIAAATFDMVAWTDDDVLVDIHWLRFLAEGFGAAPDVGLVTGLVRPLELETDAQIWRETHRGYSKGFARRVWRLAEPPSDAPLFPYTTGQIGTGANMAASRALLDQLRGFDVKLGAGTPAAGGEDLDLILRTLESGAAVLYEPAAIVSHRHHRDVEDLRSQARSYGIGLASYLCTVVTSEPRRIPVLMAKLPVAVRHLRRLRRGNDGAPSDGGLARRLRIAESQGLSIGFWRHVTRPFRRRVDSGQAAVAVRPDRSRTDPSPRPDRFAGP